MSYYLYFDSYGDITKVAVAMSVKLPVDHTLK